MTPSIFTVGLLWILAGVAFVIRGHCRHVADGAMAFVVLVLGWLASLAAPSLESRPSAVEPRTPALEHRSPSLDPSSSTIESAFVGSSLGKTYHRPECFLEVLMRRESVAALLAAIAQLSSGIRRVIEITELWEGTEKDAMQTLGIPKGTVKSRRHRGISQLRKTLAAA